MPVPVSTEPAVLKWISGRPTHNPLKSPLTLANHKAKPVVLVKTAVTTPLVTDITVFATKMVAITIHIDSEKPTSTAQVTNTPSILPRR